MAIDPRELFKTFGRRAEQRADAPLSGTKAQKLQRLQVGMFGLISKILVVWLADLVVSRADGTEASVVSDPGDIAPPAETPAPRDPLADAGVVPELPAEQGPQGSPTSTGSPDGSDAQQESGNAALPSNLTAQ